MCAKRYGKDGLKITAHQSTGTARPSTIAWPAGVCIQEFAERIQNAEISVPTATSTVATKCMRSPTRSQQNSMIPKNDASRKKIGRAPCRERECQYVSISV